MIFSFRRALVSATLLLLSGITAPITAQIGQRLKETCNSPQFPGSAKTEIDDQCGASGTGKGADAKQDKIKNNFCAPGPAQTLSFKELKNLQVAVQNNKRINFGNPREHPLSATAGATSDRSSLTKLGEGGLRLIEGYIMIARQEGAESVNCGKLVPNQGSFHDIHISLVPDEESIHGDECDAVVVEMSPHHRSNDWNIANVLWVASRHSRVRVTGQLFFDSSHTPCVDGTRVENDPSRFSLWEIHPIYKFDVCDANDCSGSENWLSLDDWIKKHPNTRQHRNS